MLAALCHKDGLIQTGPFGSQLHMSDYTATGVPVIMPTNIGDGRVDAAGLMRTSEDKARTLSRHMVRPGDIVYSRRGDITKRALIRSNEVGWLCGTGCLLVRPSKRVHRRWLSYWLAQPDIHRWLRNHAVGATMLNLNTGILGQVPVSLPPLEEQERIAGVLGAFDDLIEANRRLADQLDEVRVARVSAALAESTFETRLSDIAAFVNGRNFTKGADGVGRPVIRTPEVRSGPGGNTVWNSVEADDDRIASAGDILFVWSGTLMVNRWLYTDGLVNQHVFKVIPHEVPAWYVYALIEAQLTWFLGLAKDKATTMGHIQRAHLEEPVIGLNDAAVQRLSAVVEPIWSGALELRREAQDLARQRDDLLPLLMSGEVRVRDAEDAIS